MGWRSLGVERDYPIGPKKADIVLLLRGQSPFLIVETKRKIERAGSWRVRRLFDPLDHSVVGQALSYTAIYEDVYKQRVPFFGTANPDRIVIFKTPENLAGFVNLSAAYNGEYDKAILAGKYSELIRDYLILSEELTLSEDYIHGQHKRGEPRVMGRRPAGAPLKAPQSSSYCLHLERRMLQNLKGGRFISSILMRALSVSRYDTASS